MLQKRPQTLEKVGRNLSLFALVFMLCLLPLENAMGGAYQLAQVLVVAGFVLRLVGEMPRRFWFTAVGVFVITTGLLTGLAAVTASGRSNPALLEILKAYAQDVSLLYFCAILVLLSQLFFRPETWTIHDRPTRALLILAWAFGFIVLLSAVVSIDPIQSLRYVRKFLAPYLLIYTITVETLYSWRHYKIVITTIFLVGIVYTAASVSARYLYQYGGPDLKMDFERQKIIKRDEYGLLKPEALAIEITTSTASGLVHTSLEKNMVTSIPAAAEPMRILAEPRILNGAVSLDLQGMQTQAERSGVVLSVDDLRRARIIPEDIRIELRNQWPFLHHNRLCSYTLIIMLFVWLQFFVTRNWELKTLVAISAFFPFWAMIATLTRGGWIALAAGAFVLVLMLNWRSIWILIAIGVAIYAVAPPPVKNRVHSMINPETYLKNEGTFYLRRVIWQRSVEILNNRPVLGLGAGWDVYQDYMMRHYPALNNEDISHAHNNLLEVAVESGYSALLVFLAFSGALIVQLGRAWRSTKPQTARRFVVAGFCGLFTAIYVFGLSNYSLRYTVGMQIWVCFALITLLPSIARAIPEKGAEAAEAPARKLEPALAEPGNGSAAAPAPEEVPVAGVR